MADLLQRLQAALGTRLTLLREVGRGGMATVFLAEEQHPRRQVAVKVLDPDLASRIGRERFLREVELSARLSHPHIMPIFSAGDADDLLYYVMPYLPGESLRDHLGRAGALPLGEALQVATEVAAALDYAHRQDVVHRDIKPENILLLDGHAIVADFGVARAMIEAGDLRLTQTGSSVGTPLYMSPEQATGSQVDGRADIYALGCVVYEMLTGAPPFTGPTVEAVLASHVSRAPPELAERRPGMPAGIAKVVAKALAKSPADRWATADEFARALRACVGPGARPRAPLRGVKRRRASWIVATIALAVLGAWVLFARAGWRAHPGTASSVAVLYFDNLTRDTADAYMADGLTEEIIARLGQVGRLTTKSRAAVRRFRGTTDPASVGRELRVTHLLTGSVRRSAHRLRVNVDLVDVATGDRVWGDQLDRDDGDVLALEEGVATEVAQSVIGKLLPSERAALGRRPTADRRAYDLFLRANYDLAQRTPPSVARAMSEYEAATARDPRFSEAFARGALVYEFFLDWGWPVPGVPADSLLARGSTLADSALALDSASSDAWMATALLRSKREPRSYRGVVAAFDRAIALDPRNAEALHQYGSILRDLGRDSAAIAMSLRALAIEPERAITLVQLGLIAVVDRQLPAANRWLDSAVSVDPTFAFAYPFRSAVHASLGDTAAARSDAGMALRLGAGYRLPGEAALVVLDASVGRILAARRRASKLESVMLQPRRPVVREGVYAAAALVAAGEPDRALDLLDRIRPRGAELWAALRAPWFDPVRTLPRFRHLVTESQSPLDS